MFSNSCAKATHKKVVTAANPVRKTVKFYHQVRPITDWRIEHFYRNQRETPAVVRNQQ